MADHNNENMRIKMMEYFQSPQVQSALLKYVQQKGLSIDKLDDDELMKMIENLNLNPLQVQEQQPIIQKPILLDMFEIAENLKTVKITIKKGRLFSQLSKLQNQTKFFISINGFQQRARTNTYPVMEQFTIDELLVLKVNPNLLVMQNCHQIELAIVALNRNGTKQIYAIKNIQWRHILCSGYIQFDIQLAPYKHQQPTKMPCAGIISLKIQLSPFSNLNKVTDRLLNRSFQLQKKKNQQSNKKFYESANQFWNQYKMIHTSFQSRRIKMYAESQDKIYIPSCRFVCALYNVRGIASPNYALRFCSLIKYKEQGLKQKDINKRFHSILASSQGSVDDHSHLLCSLLLGFGLKSYVCIGTTFSGNHSWVVTIEKNSYTFWQCTKSTKYDSCSPNLHKFYNQLHCVYNHQEFYANTQLDSSVLSLDFNFKNSLKWKLFDSNIIKPLLAFNSPITFLPPTFDIYQIQQDLEFRICKEISDYRKFNKLSFNHDQVLKSILSTALTNYEMQRTIGQSFGMEQFQLAIKNHIPIKHTFKAFPIEVRTIDPIQIMQILKNQPKCREVLLAKGDQLFFGIKTKLILFPQNIFCVWLTVAVRFYKIN